MIRRKSNKVGKGNTEERCKSYKFKEVNYKGKTGKMSK